MSRPKRDTKQLICRRKSMKMARPAKRENVLTAGMLERAPMEQPRDGNTVKLFVQENENQMSLSFCEWLFCHILSQTKCLKIMIQMSDYEKTGSNNEQKKLLREIVTEKKILLRKGTVLPFRGKKNWQSYLKRKPRSQRMKRGTCWVPHPPKYDQSADAALHQASGYPSAHTTRKHLFGNL